MKWLKKLSYWVRLSVLALLGFTGLTVTLFGVFIFWCATSLADEEMIAALKWEGLLP